MNLILHPHMMYYFHSGLLTMWFTLYIEEKDQNKTEVGEAKTPLGITRLVHPVFSEKLFRNEFLLCENRKKLKKCRRNNRSHVLYILRYTEKFTRKHLCFILINKNLNLLWRMHWNININILCFNVSAKIL